MPAMQPLYKLIGFKIPMQTTKEYKILLEADLFARICEKLIEIFSLEYKNYFNYMKFTVEMENAMLETNFISLIIKDIILTGEYSLRGIAHYTDTPEDIVDELASGLNTKPLASFLRKTIELHRSVRKDLYMEIGRKISSEYAGVNPDQDGFVA